MRGPPLLVSAALRRPALAPSNPALPPRRLERKARRRRAQRIVARSGSDPASGSAAARASGVVTRKAARSSALRAARFSIAAASMPAHGSAPTPLTTMSSSSLCARFFLGVEDVIDRGYGCSLRGGVGRYIAADQIGGLCGVGQRDVAFARLARRRRLSGDFPAAPERRSDWPVRPGRRERCRPFAAWGAGVSAPDRAAVSTQPPRAPASTSPNAAMATRGKNSAKKCEDRGRSIFVSPPWRRARRWAA